MSNVSNQREIAILSNSKLGLIYLTANDWALIADKAVRRKFKPGEKIVEQGKRTRGIFLLLSGTASVQIPPPREINAGEACGEISFVDELPATADVVAKEALDAYFVDNSTLQSMFELFPHLGSRFYHSLAAILSRRLRAVITASDPAIAKPSASQS
ncbi:MAG TPA: cyclic nucleotide-binding domain-containing protein [Candidatus Acidoferrales bacterium]|nr:cyclic nucleotide-binding domain-containing protein [Candidatus Acidoferrales bacterium]